MVDCNIVDTARDMALKKCPHVNLFTYNHHSSNISTKYPNLFYSLCILSPLFSFLFFLFMPSFFFYLIPRSIFIITKTKNPCCDFALIINSTFTLIRAYLMKLNRILLDLWHYFPTSCTSFETQSKSGLSLLIAD